MIAIVILVQGLIYYGSLMNVKTINTTDQRLKHIEIELKGLVNKKGTAVNNNGDIIFEKSFENFLNSRRVSIKNIAREEETVNILVSFPMFGNRKITLYKV